MEPVVITERIEVPVVSDPIVVTERVEVPVIIEPEPPKPPEYSYKTYVVTEKVNI